MDAVNAGDDGEIALTVSGRALIGGMPRGGKACLNRPLTIHAANSA
jgi:hypothetical protein